MNDFVVFLFLYIYLNIHFTFFISLIPFSYQRKRKKKKINALQIIIWQGFIMTVCFVVVIIVVRLKWFSDNIDEMRLLTMNNEWKMPTTVLNHILPESHQTYIQRKGNRIIVATTPKLFVDSLIKYHSHACHKMQNNTF